MIDVNCGVILLSSEQEEKLLEMCKALFPDRKEARFYIEKHETSYNKFVCIEEDQGTERIHWFQFCLTHLAHRVFKELLGVDAVILIMKNMHRFVEKHPIDFLYDYFKYNRL